MKKILPVLALALILIPLTTLAAPEVLPDTLTNGADDLKEIITRVTNWIFTFLLALAVTFIVIAAYKYLLSGGGEEVGKAHKMLIYAAVAVAVALLAKGVQPVVRSLVGVPASSTTTSSTPTPTPPASPTPSTPTAVLVPGIPAPDDVRIYPCPNGHVPGVRFKGAPYGSQAGSFVNVNVGGLPQILVEQCSDGSTPFVLVNGQRYP